MVLITAFKKPWTMAGRCHHYILAGAFGKADVHHMEFWCGAPWCLGVTLGLKLSQGFALADKSVESIH